MCGGLFFLVASTICYRRSISHEFGFKTNSSDSWTRSNFRAQWKSKSISESYPLFRCCSKGHWKSLFKLIYFPRCLSSTDPQIMVTPTSSQRIRVKMKSRRASLLKKYNYVLQRSVTKSNVGTFTYLAEIEDDWHSSFESLGIALNYHGGWYNLGCSNNNQTVWTHIVELGGTIEFDTMFEVIVLPRSNMSSV